MLFKKNYIFDKDDPKKNNFPERSKILAGYRSKK